MKKKESPLSLQKLFPNYISKNTFRFFIFLMLLLLVFTLYSNDWQFKFNYIECSINSPIPCVIEELDLVLQAGESFGVMPNSHALKFNKRVLSLTLLSFVSNHLLFWIRTRKFKIPVDKEQLERLKRLKE